MVFMDADAPSTRRRNQRLTLIALGVVAVVCGAALWAMNPAVEGPFPPCPFYWLTGLQCAGCGVLRATHQLLHGNIAAAWALNPLYVVGLGLMPFAIVAWWRGVLFTKTLHVVLIIAVLVAFTIARNVV
jgi:hypothetical protein